MADILNAVLIKIPEKCRAKQCRGAKCSLELNNLPKPYVLIDMDCKELEHPAGSRCDFIFVSDEDVINKKDAWVVPIELKSGRLNPGQVIPQLRAGACFADTIMPKDIKVQFVPIVASGNMSYRPSELEEFRKYPVKFRQIRAYIKLAECGENLSDQLR